MLQITVALLALLLWLAPPVSAQDLRDPRFTAEAQAGFRHIFNLDYDEALATFSRLQSEYPQHPAPPLYMAVALWFRELFAREDLDLNKFVAPAYFDKPAERKMQPRDRQKFLDLIGQSRKLAEAVLEANPDDNDARYFVASGYGVLGAFAITVDHDKKRALDQGKKSYQLHRELVARDERYYDSYMTLGMYEYIVANLPWYIKWFAWIIGYHGSEQRGFEYLRLAADRGLYASDQARVMLMVLYLRERQFTKAMTEAGYLQEKYPRSFIFHLNRAQILEKMDAEDRAAAEYQNILSMAEAGIPNYDKLKLATARYAFGLKFMALKRPSLALAQFLASIENSQTPEREKILSHLGAAQALDLLGRRAQALAQYDAVLQLEDVERSHRRAREYIKRAYGGPRPAGKP